MSLDDEIPSEAEDAQYYLGDGTRIDRDKAAELYSDGYEADVHALIDASGRSEAEIIFRKP
jgi:hypothetical protein